jgi:hypothetical protein
MPLSGLRELQLQLVERLAIDLARVVQIGDLLRECGE